MLGVEPCIQVTDVEADIDHQKIGATPGAEHSERLLVALGVRNAGTLFHCKLGCGGELTAERADNEKSHGLAPCPTGGG